MAVWNFDEPAELNSELVLCPICYSKVRRKKRESHLPGCYERWHETLEERGLMACPFTKLHIFPKLFLNHHLEGHCDSLAAIIRPTLRQSGLDGIKWEPAPAHFLAELPPEQASDYTKLILWTFNKDLDGNPARPAEGHRHRHHHHQQQQQHPQSNGTGGERANGSQRPD